MMIYCIFYDRYGLRGMNPAGSVYLLASRAAFMVGQKWDKIPRHSTIIRKDILDDFPRAAP